jgi:DegV family protein with EDD domain
MVVKIVTDSTADLSPEMARELGITVVPVYIRFGGKTYRDGIDIGCDEFYRRLTTSNVLPTTSQPAPADFASAFTLLAGERDDIISIHLSRKTSGTYDAALQGKEIAGLLSRIEVIDSLSVSMGLGLIAITAARVAMAGANLREVLGKVKETIPHIRMMGVFDTLKYLVLGGRIGKAKALAGSLLHVKPLITMREGELVPAGMARTRTAAIERILDMVKSSRKVEEVGITYSTTPTEAVSLRGRLGSILAKEVIHITRLGPALGVHTGPGTLILALRNSTEMADAASR